MGFGQMAVTTQKSKGSHRHKTNTNLINQKLLRETEIVWNVYFISTVKTRIQWNGNLIEKFFIQKWEKQLGK